MNPILKTTQVYIENQPSQWMLYEGKSSFGADPYAYTDSEEKANHLVRACNSYEAMKAALIESKRLIEKMYSKGQGSKRHKEMVLVKINDALAIAEGKESNP